MGGGIAQLGLSRGQAPAHITGACSGGCGSQAGAVFCTGFGRRRKVKECLAQEGGAEKEGGEEGEEGRWQATGTVVGRRCAKTTGHREARSSAGGAWRMSLASVRR